LLDRDNYTLYLIKEKIYISCFKCFNNCVSYLTDIFGKVFFLRKSFFIQNKALYLDDYKHIIYMKRPRLTPTLGRVFHMKKEILLKHHALIVHKSSSLSRAQRDAVQLRVAYGLEKGLYTYDEVNAEISDLGLEIVTEISQKLNLYNSYDNGDSTEEHE